MNPKLEALLKGVGAEIPFLRGAIEALDSNQQRELMQALESKKLATLDALVREVHRLNPNLGRGLDTREGWIIRRDYHREKRDESGFLSYNEHFDKEKWVIETSIEDSIERFDAVALFLVFHNDDRDTTITDISLTLWDGESEVHVIFDRAKKGEEDWKTVIPMEYSTHVPANASIKLFFRFVSPTLVEASQAQALLKLGHTSGSSEGILTLTRLSPVPEEHWSTKSDGGQSFGVSAFRTNRGFRR